ncbi:hypothetical protein FNV43_RR02283 [Rhamnella rubrinervis]|uniref:Protein kinase domain-containing protein n=1 Tax=Rhamnella rubrinervis TaxID=2594499 RepID=A0A8K0MTY4_9ROSA|nr:hypothetical protein FNV43_RR02283 [Rhamnella rubrinervis]
MTGEAPSTSGRQFYKDTHIVLNDRAAADKNVNNFCTQTGEEFSSEFIQDRATLRRLAPVMTNVHQRLPKRVGLNYNQNHHQPVYEDLTGILGLRRDSECTSEVPDFIPGTGYVADVDYNIHPNNINRYHWEYGAIGQVPSKLADCRINPAPTAPPYYVDSPQAYHPYMQGFAEGSVSTKMRFLCSFGGRILPRPSDAKLRYVGGETRIISIRKNITWEELVKKTSTIFNQPHTIKYQLPGEDLDALISIGSDEDLHHMLEEYLEQERNEGSQRLRIFLIPLNESESPCSVEADQYVVAVNGMLDPSPQKSSSGHSLTGQTSQLLNNSGHSPRFHRDSPTTSTYNLENKDCSPNFSNLMGPCMRPPAQIFTAHQIQGNTFNVQSPPNSPVPIQYMDPQNSNVRCHLDSPYADGDEGITSFLMGKLPCQDSKCVDAVSHYHGIPLKNYHHQNKYLVEDDCSSKEDFVPYAQNGQSGTHIDGPHHKMMHALSDSQLQGHYGKPSEGVIPLSSLRTKRDKLLSVTRSSSSNECVMQGDEKVEEKPRVAKYDNQSTVRKPSHCLGKQIEETLKWINTNYSSGGQRNRKHHEGNVEVKSNDSALEFSNSPNINYVHKFQISSSQELQIFEGMVSASPVTPLENSSDIRSQNSAQDQQCSTAQRISSQRSLDQNSAASGEFFGLESIVSSSFQKVASTVNSDREACLHDKEALLHGFHDIEMFSLKREAYEGPKFGHTVSVQSQPLDGCHDDHTMEPIVIVEDITHITLPGIPSSSRVVAYVEEEGSDECTSHREKKVGSCMMESSGEDEKVSGKGSNESTSMSDAAIAEIEAGVYGLQIIKNDDLEELQELGSGTFGTVYHGKWRGTDVAIKRIKKSCFSGRSSEQERLIKDFWREARILSNLHHPNVVAFYGVVPDGPETTLATVTEFMVNGSLRHVLLKKDIVLDRRKRLLITMDTAFGMEYLHFKNIVHFDLKCDNLLVNLRDSERPICKVGDFGLSRIKRNTLVSGGVRGTLPWMAPELLSGSSNRVSEKVDVFSFGIVMWEILTGEEPYANMHCGAIIGGIVNNTLRPHIPKRCDSEWKRLMEDCWSADPATRPSFTEITNRLRDMSMALPKKRQNVVPSRRV